MIAFVGHSRFWRKVTLAAVWASLLFFSLQSSPASAQNPYLDGTPAEKAALETLGEYKLVRLREEAREILKDNPDSFAGNYLLGFSLHNSEGDLPRAKFYLERSAKLFRDKYTENPPLHSPWGWYERTILELIQVNAEMDLYEEQVAMLDEYVRLSKMIVGREPPTVLAAYAWPLMKLKREDEARQKLQEVSVYEDEGTRTTYLNTLGALEMEFGNPEASYAAFKQLLEEVRNRGWPQTATYLRNLGEASAGIGRFDEAERLYSEATRYFDTFTYSNPWFDLTFLYLAQARFSEAVDALQKTHAWRFAVQPYLAQQSWAQDQHATAELLLHLGETEKALAIAENIVRRPDRQGGDSIQLDQKETGTLLLYRALLLSEAARTQERLTWLSGWEWWQAVLERRELLAKAKIAGLKIKAMATNHDRITSSLRPYYAPGTIVISDWHRPDLVAVYGAGVTSEALEVLFRDPPRSFEHEESVLSVIQAEALWASGRRKDAIPVLVKAISDLGESRAVLRARAEARLASILFREGKTEDGIAVATRVFDTAPAMFRHLDTPIPIRLETDNDPQSKKAAALIRKSPRFTVSSQGFPLSIRRGGSSLIATLLTPQQSLINEVSVSMESQDEQEPSTHLAELFHQKVFSPRIDLSQRDINSLDGSTLTESRRTDRVGEAIGRPPKTISP